MEGNSEDIAGIYKKASHTEMQDGRMVAYHFGEVCRCDNCPWTRNCIEPPASVESVAGKIEQTIQSTKSDPGFGAILGSMIFGPETSRVKVCPVMGERLKVSPDAAKAIRAIMMDWRD